MANWLKINFVAVAFLLFGLQRVVESQETITATFGKDHARNVTIVLLRETFEGANHFCLSQGLGFLFEEKTQNGDQLVDLRHWILSTYDISMFNETLWIGFIKRTINWYRAAYCNRFSVKSLISNETDGKEQCTLLNMTQDETSKKYLLYATTCQQSSFFACYMNTGPNDYIEFNQAVIDPIPDHSWANTIQDFGNHTCFHNYLVPFYRVWAIQEWHHNNTCVYYLMKTMAYTAQAQIRQTTLNTTLRVKNATTNYHVIKPSSTIRPINNVTCSDPVVVVPSTVCQSSETQVCNCGSSLTSKELDVKVEKLKTENKVSKSSLSSYTRTKTSASDNRPSSTTMGVLGILLLTGVCVLIVSSDIPSLIRALNRLHREACKHI